MFQTWEKKSSLIGSLGSLGIQVHRYGWALRVTKVYMKVFKAELTMNLYKVTGRVVIGVASVSQRKKTLKDFSTCVLNTWVIAKKLQRIWKVLSDVGWLWTLHNLTASRGLYGSNLRERCNRSVSVWLFPYTFFFCLKNLEKKIRLKMFSFYQCKERSQPANNLAP